MSDASFAERIVSVMGSTSQVLKAVNIIAVKFEDVCIFPFTLNITLYCNILDLD